MYYKSCYFIEQFAIVFHTGLGFCCQTGRVANRPKWDLAHMTATELVDNIIERRYLLIEAFKNDIQVAYWDCKDCKRLEYKDWKTNNKVTYVNFSYYPAPCNCKCFYCNVWKNTKNSYENCKNDIVISKFVDVLLELQARDLFSKDCECQISPGEITIHPYKEELLNTIRNLRYRIFTNALIYDEKIAEILRRGTSEVFVSVDSGTRKTYHTVKGLDCFEKVKENLKRYSEDGIVFLKYIIFPGINDSDNDFSGFLEITKNYGGNRFKLARDSRENDISVDVFRAAARLIVNADNAGITSHIVYFNQSEQEVLQEYINTIGHTESSIAPKK